MKPRIRHLTTLLVLVFCTLFAWAQELYQLGNSSSYTRAPAHSLLRAVDSSPGFFRSVGGVAFDAVATGRDGLYVMDLTYEPTRADGQRLEITVAWPDGRESIVHPTIYDWELRPIARFAADNRGAAMTLFGSLENKIFEAEVKNTGGRVINYHPELDNTLVGLRLMQADILLFDANASDLPRTAADYVLGAGETRPDVAANRRRFEAVRSEVARQRQFGRTFRSYVVGDLGQSIQFDVVDDRLVFEGSPYWTMWRDPPEIMEAFVFADTLRKKQEGDLDAIRELSTPAFSSTLARHSAAVERWTAAGRPIVIDQQLSTAISRKIAAEDGINPVVYAALTKVMHFRALFRHALERDADGFERFRASLDNVPLRPEVVTPTVQRPTRPR